jgi:hypothetical protein
MHKQVSGFMMVFIPEDYATKLAEKLLKLKRNGGNLIRRKFHEAIGSIHAARVNDDRGHCVGAV